MHLPICQNYPHNNYFIRDLINFSGPILWFCDFWGSPFTMGFQLQLKFPPKLFLLQKNTQHSICRSPWDESNGIYFITNKHLFQQIWRSKEIFSSQFNSPTIWVCMFCKRVLVKELRYAPLFQRPTSRCLASGYTDGSPKVAFERVWSVAREFFLLFYYILFLVYIYFMFGVYLFS